MKSQESSLLDETYLETALLSVFPVGLPKKWWSNTPRSCSKYHWRRMSRETKAQTCDYPLGSEAHGCIPPYSHTCLEDHFFASLKLLASSSVLGGKAKFKLLGFPTLGLDHSAAPSAHLQNHHHLRLVCRDFIGRKCCIYHILTL